MNEPRAEQPATAPTPMSHSQTEPVRPSPSRRTGSSAWLNVALGLALVVAVGGVAFAAGRMTAPGPALPAGDGFVGRGPFGSFDPGANPGGVPGGFAAGGLTIEGKVEAVDTDSMTIRTASGQTIEIALGEATTYHAQSDAAADDVVAGETVLVRLATTAGRGGGAATGATASDVTVVP